MPGAIAHKVIGASTFHMEPLATTPAGHVAMRAGKPLLDLLKVKDRASFMSNLADGLKGLTPDDLDFITLAFAGNTTVDVRDPSPKNPGVVPMALAALYETQFAGHFEHRIEFLAWGLEVNFGPF